MPNTLRFEPSRRRIIHRNSLPAVALLVGFLLAAQPAQTEALAPERLAELLAFDPQSSIAVNHGRWRTFLGYYAKAVGDGRYWFNYWEVTPFGRDWLQKYIAYLSETNWPALNRDDQLAGWINFYNALSLKLVLDEPPGRRLKPKLRYPKRDSGPFSDKQVTVLDVPLSAHDIRKILLTGWADPRIHYALMGAAVGGPSINPLPYWGEYVDRQLDDAARRFINSKTGILIRSKKVYASRLFDWYQSDFGGTDSAILDHVRHFADAKLLANLEERTTIADYRYNWYLPGAHRKRYRALHFPRCWGQGRGGTHGGRGC
jgi:hypothetical protein